MIFYFSGTGNSLYTAKAIAQHTKEDLISIAALMNDGKASFEYTLKDDEIIGFVYPIYAWAPPKMVMKFIEKLSLKNYKNNYIFTAATCGGNIGNTIKVMADGLKKKNLKLQSGFSVVMPSNYMVMGNVEPKEIAEKKLIGADERIKSICRIIDDRREDVYEVEKGSMPWVLTSVINPLFNMGKGTKKFYTTDKCTGCGLCESVCTCRTIKVNGKPVWAKDCNQCLACINLCPVHAIQYGKGTEKKGRYKNPNVSINELKVIKQS
ncbi:MAG: EFR1 family ferrodoxin [Bacillota bacterium]|nr:EFR1 family ferrodoxin [Bacillota bacterium]